MPDFSKENRWPLTLCRRGSGLNFGDDPLPVYNDPDHPATILTTGTGDKGDLAEKLVTPAETARRIPDRAMVTGSYQSARMVTRFGIPKSSGI